MMHERTYTTGEATARVHEKFYVHSTPTHGKILWQGSYSEAMEVGMRLVALEGAESFSIEKRYERMP